MQIKLVTAEQFQFLKEGDILEKFPANGKAEAIFDNRRKAEINKYEIRTINHKKQSLSLVAAENVQGIFTWPGDEERLHTDCLSLVSEDIWWIS
ncbi:hypothetical protein F0919_15420 [Taibaiella lutea]|uniref:Uncharacterized protein n=1 Tax=Taibaiella lutea TaxID=2608001 RepID=A0A5M6CGE4_9BACT|nr:hypothetical protein [Taibaiella lutea]KAA5532189.1 hypothetical protein F0919_15420 [Taibaiella lutea]